jgi:hypothetical protein
MALSELLVAAVVMGGLLAPAILLVVYLVHITQRVTGLGEAPQAAAAIQPDVDHR